MFDSGKCAECGQPIIWVMSLSGNPIPIDPEPVKGGELLIICNRSQPPLGEILTKIYGPEPRYRSHVRTCPKAAKTLEEATKAKGKK